MIRQGLLAATGVLLLAGLAPAETPEGAADQLAAFLDELPMIEPGFGVVVVTADNVLMNRTTGSRRQTTGAPMTPDTPIYIASQTKAYVGLLAARLHAEGVLPLDGTIADYWPEMTLPDGISAADYTLYDLISHQVPISVDLVTELEAYATTLDPEAYPALIATHGSAREVGFDYDNLGYNIYGAILEHVTGRSWQVWLDEAIFEPTGMDHTSARTTDYSLDTLAWSHIWRGDELGWQEVRPKTDGMMQAAGGLVTSTTDMGQFLQIQLRGTGPEGSGITADMVADAQTGYAQTGMEDGRNPAELPCSEYALGWNICDFEGHSLYIHGGGYTGNRTMMAFSPDLGVGIAGFSNSDNQTGWLTSRVINMYLQFLVEHENADRMRALRIEHYPERINGYLGYRHSRLAEERGEDMWGGWEWQPDTDSLAQYPGLYATDNAYLDVSVVTGPNGLELHWGDARRQLEPATSDLFSATYAAFDSPDPVRFERDDNGAIARLIWQDRIYTRDE
jgi:CubicO group peptidase (beta-lactamase class C family)